MTGVQTCALPISKMKVKELIIALRKFDQESDIFLGSDEELNTIYKDIAMSYLEDQSKVVLWGNSGSEVQE